MDGEAAPSSDRTHDPGALAAGAESWSDEFWAALVGSVDALLRSCYGICEFTNDPDCVLRVAVSAARIPVLLSDGTRIEIGDIVCALHFWNEQLPRYSVRGPDLGWASDMRRRVVHSLASLAEHVERAPEWRGVQAFRAEAALSSRLGILQMRRLAGRYGFERVEAPATMLRQLHAIGDCLNGWSLARAFNPGALARQRLLRDRHELWISRRRLLQIYARGGGRGRVGDDRLRRREA